MFKYTLNQVYTSVLVQLVIDLMTNKRLHVIPQKDRGLKSFLCTMLPLI